MAFLQILLFYITNKNNLTLPYLTNLSSPSPTLPPKTTFCSKALRQKEFSELFVFAGLGNVRLSKFGIFLEKNGIFELAKFLQKSLEKSFFPNFPKITKK